MIRIFREPYKVSDNTDLRWFMIVKRRINRDAGTGGILHDNY